MTLEGKGAKSPSDPGPVRRPNSSTVALAKAESPAPGAASRWMWLSVPRVPVRAERISVPPAATNSATFAVHSGFHINQCGT